MKLYNFGFLCLGLVFASCGSETKTEKQEVVVKQDTTVISLDQCTKLYNEAKYHDGILLKATVVENEVAEKAIVAFFNFANVCKTDSLAPVFLVKAGQVAQSIGKFTQAQAFFTKCKDEFPEFKNRVVALFLLAQLYDDASKLNNEEEARNIYRQITREYPTSSFAADAKVCINNLGKTDEQLVQEFLKKNK